MNPTPSPVLAFLPGNTEWAVIIVLFFLLFGAKKIPELMRSLGRAQGEYQQAKREFEKEVKGAQTPPPSAPSASPYTPESDLERARMKAAELGIDTADKSLERLNQEIAEKVGGETA